MHQMRAGSGGGPFEFSNIFKSLALRTFLAFPRMKKMCKNIFGIMKRLLVLCHLALGQAFKRTSLPMEVLSAVVSFC